MGKRFFFIGEKISRVMLSSREGAAWGLNRYGKGGDEKLVGRGMLRGAFPTAFVISAAQYLRMLSFLVGNAS
ncbi:MULTISPECIES: hypothetical protein [unclassified Bartonella]